MPLNPLQGTSAFDDLYTIYKRVQYSFYDFLMLHRH